MNPINILKGWFATLVWASSRTVRRSSERLKECQKCENATESDLLKAIKGKFERVKCLRCNTCGCPVLEKSMVKNETCPLGKWKKEPAKIRWLTILKRMLTKRKTVSRNTANEV